MDLRRLLPVVLCGCLAAAGCRSESPAVLSGGKPVQYWVSALCDKNPKLRKEAAFKLGNAGSIDPTILPALVRALDDTSAAVRKEAITALAKFGDGASSAVPALRLRLRDPDREVCKVAMKALARIDVRE